MIFSIKFNLLTSITRDIAIILLIQACKVFIGRPDNNPLNSKKIPSGIVYKIGLHKAPTNINKYLKNGCLSFLNA